MKLFIGTTARYVCPKFPMHRLTAFLGVLLLACGLSVQGAKGGKPGGGEGGGSQGNPAIVFVGSGDLKVMDKDGGNQRLVLKASGYSIKNPRWYPDGQRILFYREKNWSPDGFYRVNLDGTGLTRVVAIQGTRCCRWYAEVSPVPGFHGQHRIAYQDLTPDNTGAIFVVNEDGTDVMQVTAGPDDWEPTWSPDGKHLAYSGLDGLRLLTLGENEHGLWVEEDALLIPDYPETLFTLIRPSFSKTRNKIYFTADFNGRPDVWALFLDDLLNPVNLEQLTASPGISEKDVSGSADDSLIAYEFSVTIYVANSDGSNPVAMPKGKSEGQFDPSFKR
jgi:hypothetical protein